MSSRTAVARSCAAARRDLLRISSLTDPELDFDPAARAAAIEAAIAAAIQSTARAVVTARELVEEWS